MVLLRLRRIAAMDSLQRGEGVAVPEAKRDYQKIQHKNSKACEFVGDLEELRLFPSSSLVVAADSRELSDGRSEGQSTMRSE